MRYIAFFNIVCVALISSTAGTRREKRWQCQPGLSCVNQERYLYNGQRYCIRLQCYEKIIRNKNKIISKLKKTIKTISNATQLEVRDLQDNLTECQRNLDLCESTICDNIDSVLEGIPGVGYRPEDVTAGKVAISCLSIDFDVEVTCNNTQWINEDLSITSSEELSSRVQEACTMTPCVDINFVLGELLFNEVINVIPESATIGTVTIKCLFVDKEIQATCIDGQWINEGLNISSNEQLFSSVEDSCSVTTCDIINFVFEGIETDVTIVPEGATTGSVTITCPPMVLMITATCDNGQWINEDFSIFTNEQLSSFVDNACVL